MSDALLNLALGFQVAVTPENLLLCLTGAAIGTLIGVLPGLGPTATIAMLLPITFHLPPTGGLIMLAGIFYGSQYGGSTTAILVNLPGESSSVVTCLDGYVMARKGRAGAALTIAALASLTAGIITTAAIAGFGPPLASIALAFGPAEYVALMTLGLTGAMAAAKGSRARAAVMVGFGLLLAMVGTDVSSGEERYTFGVASLFDGIDFVPLTMGLFGIAEIIANLETTGGGGVETAPVGSLWPNREEMRRSWPAALRGTVVGTLFGALPGGGATISSFAAYALEKRVARDPSRFGRGAPEGVAGPEAANNAGAQAGFIPMLALGIPPNAVMAMMIGAMMIHGITPGPRIIELQPDLFWGLIVSMLMGNVMLVILNLPLIGLWVRLLRIPYAYMFPAILVFCCVGAYSLNNSVVDVLMMAGFGVFGHILRKLEFEPVPLLMGFVLGKMLEENLRRALLLSAGDPTVFLTRPISAGLLAAAVLLLIAASSPATRERRGSSEPKHGG